MTYQPDWCSYASPRLTVDDGPGNAGPASARIFAGAGDAILARAGRYQ